MRLPILSVLLAAACATAFAEPAPPADEPRDPKAAAVEHMISERASAAAFEKAAAEARKQGASEQAVLEARFLFHVDRREDAAIAALLPEFQKRRDNFNLAESEIFAVKEDWLAVIDYVEAIAALQKGDRDGFKKHILEAFWLSPRQGAAFAPHIERLRMEEAMRELRFNFEPALMSLAGKDKVDLKALAAGKKAVLLFFWSPWSRECETLLPDFAATARDLESRGIAVVSIVTENATEVLTEARGMLEKLDKPGGAWVVDDAEQPLHRMFRVQGIPMMVLLSPEGKVRFNGNPAEDKLWEELAALTPGIKRPASPDGESHSHEDH